MLPGWIVELNGAGSVRKSCFWDWGNRIPSVRENSLEDTGQRFGELLREAVAERLPGERAAAHLSGGMDSSSVTLLAHDWMAAHGGDELATISLVYNHHSLAGERPYIEMILEREDRPAGVPGRRWCPGIRLVPRRDPAP